MANNSDSDLVSQVRVEGLDQATQGLKDYSEAGAAAFDKINEAAGKAGESVNKASDTIEKSLKNIGSAAPDAGVPTRLQNIALALQNVKREAGNAVTGTAKFGATLIGIGATAVTVMAGIAKFASSVTQAARAGHDASKESVNTQKQMIQSSLQGAQANTSYRQSVQQLNRDLAQGKMSYQDYGKALSDLDWQYKQNASGLAEMEAAQVQAKKDEQRVEEIAARNKAWDDLAKTYGGPMTNSLIKLGNTYDSLKGKIRDSVSPILSNMLEKLNSIIEKNKATIEKFVTDAAKAIEKFLQDSGPSIEQFGVVIGQAIEGAGIIIQNVLLPAFRVVIKVAEGVASAINKVFGGNITAGAVLLVGVVAKLTGGFSALFSIVRGAGALFTLIRAFGPWGIAISLVVAALTTLFTLDWSAVGTAAANMVQQVTKTLSGWGQSVSNFFSNLWQGVINLTKSAASGISSAWQSVLDFFSQLGSGISNAFSLLWNEITTSAGNVVTNIKTGWQGFVDFISQLAMSIGQYFSDLWQGITDSTASVVQAVVDAWKGLVDWFAGLPEALSQVWTNIKDAITNAFKAAVDAVSGYFSSMKDTVMGYINSMIEGLKRLLGMQSETTGKTADKAKGYASGGSPWANSNGKLRGPGTSTSDSIFAWLSRDEFVMRARAVQRYGVGFMRAINSGTLDLSRIAGFAVGGLVGGMAGVGRPAYATASDERSGGASRILNLTIGDQSFSGLSAPEDVASRLERYAITQQTRSAGRKPGWRGN